MLTLTPDDRKQLRKALLSSYPNYATLKIFVSDNFAFRLNDIASSQALEVAADELIDWVEARGKSQKLIQALQKTSPDNKEVKILMEHLQGLLPQQQSLEIDKVLQTQVSPERVVESSYSSPVVTRKVPEAELVESPNSTHLVITVFWEKPSSKTIKVHPPKFCYRNCETHDIVHTPLLGDIDSGSFPLDKFPTVLVDLVNRAEGKAATLYRSWKLTIELFIPLELLCAPLSIWCGHDSGLLKDYPIVIGCSDRFNPDQKEARSLYNWLEQGWERFRERVPDKEGAKLSNLNWLNSDDAGRKSLRSYSGFQCYGDWLVPGDWEKLNKPSQERWLELVRSGIPLALWMCGEQPQRQDAISTFKRLTDGTRFDFLDRISPVRDEQQKTCHYCVGILYEDLNYIPEVPKMPEQQFFSWPGA